jgi:hypothetical protein
LETNKYVVIRMSHFNQNRQTYQFRFDCSSPFTQRRFGTLRFWNERGSLTNVSETNH